MPRTVHSRPRYARTPVYDPGTTSGGVALMLAGRLSPEGPTVTTRRPGARGLGWYAGTLAGATLTALVLVSLLAYAVMAYDGTGDRARSAAPTAARTTVRNVGAGVLALNWGDLDATPDAWRGSYVLMQPWEYDRIPAYRDKHPA